MRITFPYLNEVSGAARMCCLPVAISFPATPRGGCRQSLEQRTGRAARASVNGCTLLSEFQLSAVDRLLAIIEIKANAFPALRRERNDWAAAVDDGVEAKESGERLNCGREARVYRASFFFRARNSICRTNATGNGNNILC